MSTKELITLPKNEEFVQMVLYQGQITIITTKRILRGSAVYGTFSESKLKLEFTDDNDLGVSIVAEAVTADDEILF